MTLTHHPVLQHHQRMSRPRDWKRERLMNRLTSAPPASWWPAPRSPSSSWPLLWWIWEFIIHSIRYFYVKVTITFLMSPVIEEMFGNIIDFFSSHLYLKFWKVILETYKNNFISVVTSFNGSYANNNDSLESNKRGWSWHVWCQYLHLIELVK